MELSEAFSYWLGSAERRHSTATRYAYAIDRLRALGLRGTGDVTRERVCLLQRELVTRGWSVVSVRAEFAALRSVLAQLAKDGIFSKPLLVELRESALPAPDRGRKRRVRFLSRLEFERLAHTAAKIAPRIEPLLRVAVWSGVRTGELVRMRREDVRGDHFWVETLPEWGEAGSCKTGPRPVPICRELARVLERLPRSGWLFPSVDSRFRAGRRPATPFVSRWTYETTFALVRSASGFGKDVKPMTLRHTRASWWLQGRPPEGGASIYKVADFLGHAVATCEKFYGSLVDGYDAECERAPASA